MLLAVLEKWMQLNILMTKAVNRVCWLGASQLSYYQQNWRPSSAGGIVGETSLFNSNPPEQGF
jgi:hypothetical protein